MIIYHCALAKRQSANIFLLIVICWCPRTKIAFTKLTLLILLWSFTWFKMKILIIVFMFVWSSQFSDFMQFWSSSYFTHPDFLLSGQVVFTNCISLYRLHSWIPRKSTLIWLVSIYFSGSSFTYNWLRIFNDLCNKVRVYDNAPTWMC